MTSKTHAVLGLVTSIMLLKYNQSADTYTLMSGVVIGSLLPDLDTQKSDPAQIFPPVAWIVDKLTKHRGFTHTLFPLLLLASYYFYGNKLCLWLGIGACTHVTLDFITKALRITCGSGGEQTIFIVLWGIVGYVILEMLWRKYNLYVPKEYVETFNQYSNKIFTIK